ncbi:cell division protease FtsH [Symbiobacterium terraclitae]|uniref:ATP-dependent zinc metalloprotease FtsH n=1 Tax=Symbiobacterium terraclitae TaxID=557451 RepID=A0ABS4JSX6_9FIRM|nr:ATP-dependent zinc metalloprotease FtsH [Symbiobacterium terraclitae]MBP2018642.1 cell division protease FtsH [Symbiobacterium terraclitae]
MPAVVRWWVGAVLVAAALLLSRPAAAADAVPVPYSQFLRDVQARQVAGVRISGQRLDAVYRDGSLATVTLPPGEARLQTLLLQYGVRLEYAHPADPSVLRTLVRLVPPLVVLGAILWLSRRETGRGRGGLLWVEQSPARLYRPGSDAVTLRDVAGLDEVKAELQEVVDFLREPQRYAELGARIPRGILLSGPPGTGKTLLARAVAGEAGVPFFSASGSDFVELYAGTGAARVRALFARARQSAPCILFIDEIDALARQRGVSPGGGAEEREQTVNQLLVEMDGFESAEGVILIAATNRPDILDPAILRPGRFDRQLTVEPPDRKGREQILEVHARSRPLSPDVQLADVARLTPGFTGADLANLLNEAALLAVREGLREIGWRQIALALERVASGGPPRRIRYAAEDRLRVAYHEAGHAIVGLCVRGPGCLVRVTLLPYGRAYGHTLFRDGEEERLVHSRKEVLDRLAELLAGRAAEELALGEPSAGAADDLERATQLARQMVTRWGMHPEIGPLQVSEAGQGPGEESLRAVDRAMRSLVEQAAGIARSLLDARRPALDRLAAALLERERLEGAEVEALLAAGAGAPADDRVRAVGGAEALAEARGALVADTWAAFRAPDADGAEDLADAPVADAADARPAVEVLAADGRETLEEAPASDVPGERAVAEKPAARGAEA